MNIRSLLLPRAALTVAILATSILHAQTPPAGDPFVKDAASTAAGGDASKKAESWQNCLFTLEIYALDKNDAFTVLDTEHGSAARYRRVLDLAKAGKARLDTLTALTSKSGQRAITESVSEVRFPTVPNPAAGVTWEARNAGDTFELEAVLSPDNRSCDLNVVPQHVSLDDPGKYTTATGAPTVTAPIFRMERLTTSISMGIGQPQYLSTFTPPQPQGMANGAVPSEVRLAFVHLSLPGATAEELTPAKPDNWKAVQLEFSCFSVDRAQAREILLGANTLKAPWEKLQALLGEKKARLEHVMSLQTKSGQRAVIEESQAVQVLNEFNPNPPQPKEGTPPQETASSTPQNAGATVEVEPVVLRDGRTVDINYAIQSVIWLGDTKAAATKPTSQPTFETRKITSSQSILAGGHQLIGTLNPPTPDGAAGRADSARTWLLFVRATPSEP